jgi:PEP-CTERM motif
MSKRMLHGIAGVVGAFLGIGGSSLAYADVNLWIDDAGGNIGLVDITTGTVSMVNNTGQTLTDIGFIGSQMYGVTFTNLFSIDRATGASTLIGSSFTGGAAGMNALVGAGAGLLGASSASTDIYSISPTTGVAAVTTSVPLISAGDLAFAGGSLFESAVDPASGAGQLVDVTTASVVAQFHTTSISAFDDVFGLADDGTSMYAVSGTEIYTVNLSNGLLTPVLDYSGHGLGPANGTAFLAESGAIPEPSTWAMMLLGFAGLGVAGYRRSRKNVAIA